MATPSDVGAAAERELSCALHRAGWGVFAPMFDAHRRIDLVSVDPAGVAHRIQVKTSRVVRQGTVLCFRTCSNTGNRPVDYRDQVDQFGVWSPQLAQAFLVPVDVAPSRLCHLRLVPAANGQQAGIRFAEQYAITSPTVATRR